MCWISIQKRFSFVFTDPPITSFRTSGRVIEQYSTTAVRLFVFRPFSVYTRFGFGRFSESFVGPPFRSSSAIGVIFYAVVSLPITYAFSLTRRNYSATPAPNSRRFHTVRRTNRARFPGRFVHHSPVCVV